MKKKPEATPIREETKRILKARAAMQGVSLVDYLDAVLDFYFEAVEKGEVDEQGIIEDRVDQDI